MLVDVAVIAGFSGLKLAVTAAGGAAVVAGVNRLVRLPVGVNGKAKYGPTPFPTVLHSYDPTIRLSVETAIDALAATKASVADTAAAAVEVKTALEAAPLAVQFSMDRHAACLP